MKVYIYVVSLALCVIGLIVLGIGYYMESNRVGCDKCQLDCYTAAYNTLIEGDTSTSSGANVNVPDLLNICIMNCPFGLGCSTSTPSGVTPRLGVNEHSRI